MKTLLSNITLCITFILMLTACSKENGCRYDAGTIIWTKSHIDDIKTMNRTRWLNIDTLSYQISAYSEFSASQRMNLWTEKLSEALQLDWFQKERMHIVRMIYYIDNNPQWFNGNLPNDKKEYDYFKLITTQWKSFAKDSLNWNDKQIAALINSPFPLDGQDGAIKLPVNMRDDPGEGDANDEEVGGRLKCNCNRSNYELTCAHVCNPTYVCSGHTFICGILWGENCNGICE